MTRASTSFKIKGSNIRVTGRLTQTHKTCHIFRAVRPENFNVGVRMEDVDPHQQQAPWPPRWKVKVTRSRGMSDPCGPYYEICSWYSDKVPRCLGPMTDNRGNFQGQRHRLYTSDLCLFLIRETKCCTCVITGGRGHTVSAEPGGHTSCLILRESSLFQSDCMINPNN